MIDAPALAWNTMNRSAPTTLLALLVVISGITTALIVADYERVEERQPVQVQFQQLMGGLGFGPATDWSRCEHSFDPRFLDGCDYDGGPLPGHECFCPYHTKTVHSHSPIQHVAAEARAGDDADVP